MSFPKKESTFQLKGVDFNVKFSFIILTFPGTFLCGREPGIIGWNRNAKNNWIFLLAGAIIVLHERIPEVRE